MTAEGDDYDKKEVKKPSFKNHAPFRSCILKINNTFIDGAEDPDIVRQCKQGANQVIIIHQTQKLLFH